MTTKKLPEGAIAGRDIVGEDSMEDNLFRSITFRCERCGVDIGFVSNDELLRLREEKRDIVDFLDRGGQFSVMNSVYLLCDSCAHSAHSILYNWMHEIYKRRGI